MSTFFTMFLFVFVFSPLMLYGIGLETLFTESFNLKKVIVRLPLFIINVLLTVLISKPLSAVMMSLVCFDCLIPVIVFVTSALISAVSVFISPYVFSDGRPFSGLFSFGLTLLAVMQSQSMSDALLLAFSGVVSFALAAVFLSAISRRLQLSNVPLYFKGIPLIFISLGFLSLLVYAASISWWITE